MSANLKGKKSHPYAEDRPKNEPFKSRHLQSRVYDEDNYEQAYATKAHQNSVKNSQPGKHTHPERPKEKHSLGPKKYLEDENQDAISCYEAISCTSDLRFEKSRAGSTGGKSDMSHLSYQTWNDNKSLQSFASEHTIVETKLKAKKNLRTAQELVDFDEHTIAKIRERSRSRDIRGHRIRSITGVEIPLNEPTRAEASDEESDLDVDMGKIATNIPNLGKHTLHKLSDLAEFNPPQEKKISEMRLKERQRGLEGREVKVKMPKMIDDDYYDKENEHGKANFVNLKKGLMEGLVSYENIKFSTELLDRIDASQWNDDDFVKPRKSGKEAKHAPGRQETLARHSAQVRRFH